MITIVSFLCMGFSIDSTLNKGVTAVKAGVKTIDTSSTFKMIYSDVKQGITALAASLKVTADQVFQILVMQQRVKAVIYSILLITGIWFVTLFARGAANTNQKWMIKAGNEDLPTFLGIIRWFQVISGVVLFIIGMCHIDVIVMGIMNPSYGAIQDIMDMVKGK